MPKYFNLLSVLLVCGHHVVRSDVFVHKDYVLIDDQDNFDEAQFEYDSESTTVRPSDVVEGDCYTSEGFQGTCQPLQSCFPYTIFNPENPETQQDMTYGLLSVIQNFTEPCSDPKSVDKGYICCPDFSYGYAVPEEAPEVEEEEAPADTLDASSNDTSQCGSYTYSETDGERVVGGRLANKGEFPWAVALLKSGRQFCGGSLIDERHVLTAAHCVVPIRSFATVRANLGDHDISRPTEAKHDSVTVVKAWYHRGFSMKHLQNDIAVLRLSRPVKFTDAIQPVCINRKDPYEFKKVEVCGWGKTSLRGPQSTTLKTVTMTLKTHAACKARYQGLMAPPITNNVVCCGQRTADACNGDSGGPLQAKVDGKGYQVGIVSWGIGCGEYPGVYTRVDKYLSWIGQRQATP